VWPCAFSFLAVSGVMATRVSPAVISAGTPMSMGDSSKSLVFWRACEAGWPSVAIFTCRQAYMRIRELFVKEPYRGDA
jgi:hypothetical protein